MPKVSVIIPVYGVEKFIARCASSLFEQTLDDIEFLFVNDCTKDNSIMILKSVLEKYPNRKEQVQVLEMQKNSGQAAVRKYGMLAATGDYVIHCDSDDWIDRDMYKILYEKAISENLDIVWCDYYRTNGIDSKRITTSKSPRLMQGPLWNKLVKRSLYIDNEIIFPQCNKAEDGALMTQISFYAQRIAYIPKALYYYYINPNSICCQSSEEACLEKLKQEMSNVKLKMDFLRSKGMEEYYNTEVLVWKLESRQNLLPHLNKRKFKNAWKNNFKEINTKYLLSSGIPFKSKLKFLYLLVKCSL